jgi:hypothetical protein
LGVPREASADELRRAFTRLAKEHHPDVNAGPAAAARFQSVMEAFEVLREPRARLAYDARRRGGVTGDGGYDAAAMRARSAAFERARESARAAAADAEASARAGGGPAGARGFSTAMAMLERALRPRSLAGGALVCGAVWWLMEAVGGAGVDDAAYGRDGGARVPAWWNAESARWETPAPWSPRFRAHETRMVPRHLVHAARPPVAEAPAPAAAAAGDGAEADSRVEGSASGHAFAAAAAARSGASDIVLR